MTLNRLKSVALFPKADMRLCRVVSYTALTLFFLSAIASAHAQDAASIVKKAILQDDSNLAAQQSYIYQENHVVQSLDNNGDVKKTESILREYFNLDGVEYQRVLTRDGKPLSSDDRQKQESKIEKRIALQKQGKLATDDKQYQKSQERKRDALQIRNDLVNGFTFMLLGSAVRNGRSCWEIAAEPKPGFHGQSRIHAVLPYFHGTIYVDKATNNWVEIDASPIKQVGGGLAYLGADSFIHVTQQDVNGEFWRPNLVDARFDARLLWDRKNVHITDTYQNFRKFRTDVELLPFAAMIGSARP